MPKRKTAEQSAKIHKPALEIRSRKLYTMNLEGEAA